ncbi:MAG: peptidase M23, partial [Staphylococcus epidermidis]|nr:peptidase M23 [Staphylococcus epidermidis]MDU6096749.1 peptidase M23 [Staphylococcus epidermidis]MDU6556694.1 peptidase M23 [Staphylococcus epidermidis]
GVVESINSNGSVTVSEMNWNGGVNVKSYRTISNPNSYNYIH